MANTERKLAFESPPDRGFIIKAWYVQTPGGDAEVELFYEGNRIRHFFYPAYKVWNLAAHFSDIVESEINDDERGYLLAGSTGLGGVIMPDDIAPAPPSAER